MSRVERAPSQVRTHRPVAIELVPRSLRTLTISWLIGADALRAASPDIARAILGAQPAKPDEQVTLALRVDLTSSTAGTLSAELIGPKASTPLPIPDTRITVAHDPSLRQVHLDAADAALLRATVALDDVTPRLLYARTSLLTHLKLRGGRYEPDQARGE